MEKIGENRMTLNQIKFKTPVVRVLDKDANISFYQETLGFRLVSEENTLAIFSGYQKSENIFMLEESPTYRTRAVNGLKKHHKTVIKVSESSDIEALLGRGMVIDKLFQGNNGYAFEATSPEGYTYLLHAEDDREKLVEIEKKSFSSQVDFKGLSDFVVDQIILNVPDVEKAKVFYTDFNFPVNMDFVQAKGEDLQTDPDTVWDLEYLEFSVPKDFDLVALKEQFEAKGIEVYLDKKETVLVISDTSNIELWFSK